MLKIISIATLVAATSVSAGFFGNNNSNWGPFDSGSNFGPMNSGSSWGPFNGGSNWGPFNGGSNAGPFNGAQNWGPFQGGNNWLNNTDFGLKFNTKNTTDTNASGAADGSAKGVADANAKGVADAYAKGVADAYAKGVADAYAKGQADASILSDVNNIYQNESNNTSNVFEITGSVSGSIVEDAQINKVSGSLIVSNIDKPIWSIKGVNIGKYGSLGVDKESGKWTYVLNNSDKDTQLLAQGQVGIDIFELKVGDGSDAYGVNNITINVQGRDEANLMQGVDDNYTYDWNTETKLDWQGVDEVKHMSEGHFEGILIGKHPMSNDNLPEGINYGMFYTDFTVVLHDGTNYGGVKDFFQSNNGYWNGNTFSFASTFNTNEIKNKDSNSDFALISNFQPGQSTNTGTWIIDFGNKNSLDGVNVKDIDFITANYTVYVADSFNAPYNGDISTLHSKAALRIIFLK